jgi:hypothetical protein
MTSFSVISMTIRSGRDLCAVQEVDERLAAELRVADGAGQRVDEDLGGRGDARRGEQRPLPAQPVELHHQLLLLGGAEERVGRLQAGPAGAARERLVAEHDLRLQVHDRLEGGHDPLAQDDVEQPLAHHQLVGLPLVRGLLERVAIGLAHAALGVDERVVHRHPVADLDARRRLEVGEGRAAQAGGERRHHARLHGLEVGGGRGHAAAALAAEQQQEAQPARTVERQHVVVAVVLPLLLEQDGGDARAHLLERLAAVLALDLARGEASSTTTPRLPRSARSRASSGRCSW